MLDLMVLPSGEQSLSHAPALETFLLTVSLRSTFQVCRQTGSGGIFGVDLS